MNESAQGQGLKPNLLRPSSLCSVEEVAELLGTTPRSVTTHAKRGQLRARWYRGALVVHEEDLVAFISSRWPR